VPQPLARQVAVALHEAGPLEAHLHDELGHHESGAARPAPRVLIGGAPAMAVNAAVGQIAHVSGV